MRCAVPRQPVKCDPASGLRVEAVVVSAPLTVLRPMLAVGLMLMLAPTASMHGQTERQRAPSVLVDPRPIRLPIVDGADIRFQRISTADALAQTKVDQIVQDDLGFMWFGTPYGLNRYDGYVFKDFVHDPGNAKSLSGVSVHALFKDRDGALWVGCDQYLNRFNQVTETFTRYPIPFVTHISQDSAGMLWLATVSGLWRLDPATGR
ncbi:MAG TPA: two-component regulator propeller domain-containing protein, partial [Bryobacteraceae bacterium]|nr:two-component regulator propeller domain-containing protein [Bryobacteraceae bacterium]